MKSAAAALDLVSCKFRLLSYSFSSRGTLLPYSLLWVWVIVVLSSPDPGHSFYNGIYWVWWWWDCNFTLYIISFIFKYFTILILMYTQFLNHFTKGKWDYLTGLRSISLDHGCPPFIYDQQLLCINKKMWVFFIYKLKYEILIQGGKI